MKDNDLYYIDTTGNKIEVECLDYLETGYFFDEEGEMNICSRFYIGEIDGDSQSVWLDEDLQEVEAE